jgi:glycosyltransferase involved in cell wall biosynthesis
MSGDIDSVDRLNHLNDKWDLNLSIIIPLKDEGQNVNPLRDEVDAAMGPWPYTWECVWVDDGSTDNTLCEIQRINQEDNRHQYVALSQNYGQSAALHAGFCHARGDILVTLDGDGQNDPKDIPNLVEFLRDGNYDMVNGVRRKRQDNFIRKVSSRIANGFRNWLTHENITDVGCSLRAFRHECVQDITPFRGCHRFLPTLIRICGYSKIAEIAVSHRPRKYGQTSYGISNRLWVGLMDTLAVRWMQNRVVFGEIKSKSPPIRSESKDTGP